MVRIVGLNGVLPFDSQARWSQAKLGYAGSFLIRCLRVFRGCTFSALRKLQTRPSSGKKTYCRTYGYGKRNTRSETTHSKNQANCGVVGRLREFIARKNTPSRMSPQAGSCSKILSTEILKTCTKTYFKRMSSFRSSGRLSKLIEMRSSTWLDVFDEDS